MLNNFRVCFEKRAYTYDYKMQIILKFKIFKYLNCKHAQQETLNKDLQNPQKQLKLKL